MTDEEIDEVIHKAMKHFCLTDIGDVGGSNHAGWANISGSVFVADLIAVVNEQRNKGN